MFSQVSLDRKWSQVESVWEIAEAVSNLVTIVHYTRNYSYEAIALQRALHDYGWFLGISSSEREQMELLECGVDKILARNSQRARTNLPPMTYESIRAALRTFLHSKGKPESGLFGVDPYAGRKKLTEEARLSQSIKSDVLAQLKAAGWSKQGGQTHKSKEHKVKPQDQKKKEGGKSKGDLKVQSCCPDFNSPSGCTTVGDSCGKGAHKCSKRSGEFVCLRTGHSRQNCDHPKLV